ncbi:hypothetical protein JR316_0008352 [Psilocybe cubensis]|uniref:BTB domain-containing protein n=2 Tax=Psilocybe cubensis TaxID=181762 RepID=A0A8H8CJ81_PSICU|nr:hypothetical protein JR316_0008352 [Psilocybe cubensis]KAH9479757.1 hypothetical protein JR316_0008352 [Psilocybe cubensis]
MSTQAQDARTHPKSFTRLSLKVDLPDSDVTILSSDNMRFNLHQAKLALNTGGLPSNLSTMEETVQLSEPSSVLEIAFQFVYIDMLFDDDAKISFLMRRAV